MVKIRTKYRGYTPTMLKSRADIPRATDIAVNTNDIGCSNIDVDYINDVLGSSVSDIVGLCRHDNVNSWSGFGPTVRSVAAQALVNSKPSICELDSFAGYNHQAVTPGWFSEVPSGTIWVNVGGIAEFEASVYVGEVRWSEIGAVGIVHAIYDGESLVAWVGRHFDGSAVLDDATGLYVYVNNIALEKTYTGRMWLVNSIEDFDGSQIVCRLPNTSDYTRSVKILPATLTVLDAPGDFTGDVGWSNTPSPGWVRYGNLQSPNPYTQVRVYANIYGFKEGRVIGSDILLDTYDYWMYDMFGFGEGQPNGAWYIPTYGYLCTIRVEVTY